MKKSFTILSLPILAFLISQNSLAATTSGQVVYTTSTLTAQSPNQASRALNRRSSFYQADTIKSGANTTAQLRFTDGTLLGLRPNTTVVVNNYNFPSNPASNSSALNYSVNFVVGGLREVSGTIAKINPNNYQITSNVATIGVRGTDFSCVKAMSSNLYCQINQGQIKVSNKAGSAILDSRTQNRYVYVASSTTAPQILATQPRQLQNDVPLQAVAQTGYTPVVAAPVVAQANPTPVAATTALATPNVTEPYFASGFVVGAAFGYQAAESNVTMTTLAKTVPGAASPPRTLQFFGRTNSPLGQIDAGYQYVIDDFSIAAEAFASQADNKIQVTLRQAPGAINSTSYTGKMNTSYGALLEPGIIIANRNLVFAEVGVVSTRFEFQNTGSLAGALPLTFDPDKDMTGTVAGAGYAFGLSSRLSVSVAGSYTNYNNVRRQFGPTQTAVLPNNAAIIKSTAFSASNSVRQVNVGLNYRF